VCSLQVEVLGCSGRIGFNYSKHMKYWVKVMEGKSGGISGFIAASASGSYCELDAGNQI
jgi:hypothetical protein